MDNMNWQDLWNKMESEPAPPSREGKHRASSLPAKMHCTKFVSSGGSDAATRGKCLHYIMEHDHIPFDIPDSEADQIDEARNLVQSLLDDGWEVYGKEVFLENERITVNMDLLFIRGKDMIYADLKFGNAPVESDSAQMACGAEGIFSNYSVGRVFTTIIQPSIRTHSLHLKEWSSSEANDVVTEAIREKIGVSKYCQYCDISGTCEYNIKRAKNIKDLHKK